MKFKRISNFFIVLKENENYIIGKDFGSMGRSKPFYFVQVGQVVVMHGFTTQKEAKKYLEKLLTNA